MTEHDATHVAAPHRPLSDSVPPEEPRTPSWLTTVGLVLLVGLALATVGWFAAGADAGASPAGVSPAKQADRPTPPGAAD